MSNRRRFLRLVAALSGAGAVFTATPAHAVGSLVDVQLVDRERSQPLPTYQQRGTHWVAGRPGSRYAVRMSNRSGERVLVVLSVDGVNAVSGETAATGQVGYVLAPWQTTEITGWRKSMSEAAAFYFTALPDSYAARTDRPDNVGVIGVAVFRERETAAVLRQPAPPLAADARPDESRSGEAESNRDRASGRAAPSAKSAAPMREERLGTGHGERIYAPTTQTTFERASERPAEVVRLRYDSVENLLASGVIPRPWRRPAAPEPFPGFVPDPRG